LIIIEKLFSLKNLVKSIYVVRIWKIKFRYERDELLTTDSTVSKNIYRKFLLTSIPDLPTYISHLQIISCYEKQWIKILNVIIPMNLKNNVDGIKILGYYHSRWIWITLKKKTSNVTKIENIILCYFSIISSKYTDSH